MNNRNVIALGSIVIIVFFFQFIMMQDLNNKLNILTQKDTPVKQPQSKKLSEKKKSVPSPDLDNKFFNTPDWEPYKEMQRIQDEMDKVFGDSFSRLHKQMPLNGFKKTPAVNLQEKSDRYIVTVNAPGAEESSLKVELEDQQLSISIRTEKTNEQSDEDNGTYSYRERFMGEFNRILTLPGPADAAKMTSKYRNGVLTITIPKK